MTARFDLGQTVATPDVLALLIECGQSLTEFLRRHINGDWGELDAEDRQANEDALVHGDRLLSAYRAKNGRKLWIITEAADDEGHRPSTTLLLPSEY